MGYLDSLEEELEAATRAGKPAERIAAIKKEIARVKGGKVERSTADNAAETADAPAAATPRGRK